MNNAMRKTCPHLQGTYPKGPFMRLEAQETDIF